MIGELFQWLDGDPVRFRVAAGFGVVGCAALAWLGGREKTPRWLRSPLGFGAALLLALFLFRWPVVLATDRMGNPDEAQIVADAIAYARDPVPFRSVDPNTAGPFSALSLLAFSKVVFRPLDFVTARLFGLCCVWALALSVWRVLATATAESRARWLTLPALLALGAGGVDLFQFNNEHPAAAALALGFWALAPLVNDARTLSRERLLLGAVLIGVAPLVKPQAAPLTLVLATLGGIGLWRHAPTREWFGRALGWYAFGGLLPLTLVVLSCAVNGLIGDVLRTFVGNNLTYASGREFPWWKAWQAIDALARDSGPPRRAFGAAAVALLFGAVLWRGATVPTRRLGITATILFLGAAVTAAAPGKHFIHYIFFLLQPAGLLIGAAAGASWERRERGGVVPANRAAGVVLTLLWLALAIVPVVVGFWRIIPPGLGAWGRSEPVATRVREAVARYSKPGDALAVWGWAPWIYVWTQSPHASREAVTQRQIEQWGDYEYYRDRFVADLQRTRPALFIDAVGPADFSYGDLALSAHEASAQVARFVATHYVATETVDGLRLFVRRDLAAPALLATQAAALDALSVVSPRPQFWAALPPSVAMHTDGGLVLSAHAPSQLAWAPAAQPRRARFIFGLRDDATRGNNLSDGVEFRVFTVDFATGEEHVLFTRLLRPLDVAADRGEHSGEVMVPPGVTVIFETGPGPSRRNSWDWSYWRTITLEPAAGR